jgi:mannose/cellobiose epimerase-like protein (N-acyl-D-glucosamine 2-epimerase family)
MDTTELLAEAKPAASTEAPPDFRSRDFLLSHVRDTLAFYAPTARDPSGGFFHFFKDDGSVYDRTTRHLVSSTRFVFNYAMASNARSTARVIAMAWRSCCSHAPTRRWRASTKPGR